MQQQCGSASPDCIRTLTVTGMLCSRMSETAHGSPCRQEGTPTSRPTAQSCTTRDPYPMASAATTFPTSLAMAFLSGSTSTCRRRTPPASLSMCRRGSTMTPTPGRLACLSLQKVHCSICVCEGNNPAWSLLWESSCSAAIVLRSSRSDVTAPHNRCSRADTNSTWRAALKSLSLPTVAPVWWSTHGSCHQPPKRALLCCTKSSAQILLALWWLQSEHRRIRGLDCKRHQAPTSLSLPHSV